MASTKENTRIADLHAVLCPALDCQQWSPKRPKLGNSVADNGTASEDKTLNHVTTTPWLLLYMMFPICRSTKRVAEGRSRRQKCMGLLEWASKTCTKSYKISIPETGQEFYVAGGRVHVIDHGMRDQAHSAV